MMRDLFFGIHLLRSKLTGKNVPYLVQLSITNHCNLKCVYCYAGYPGRKHKDLSYEQIVHIVDQLAKLGTKRINIVGGEPLLRPDISDIISHIKSLGMECTMTSNGAFVPQKIDAVKKLDLLCLSLDGTKEANDAVRGAGVHNKVIKALEIARANGVVVQFSTVLNRNNLTSIDYLLDLGKKYHVYIAFTTLIKPVDSAVNYAALVPSDEEYKQALRKLIQLKRDGAPILFSFDTLRHTLNWPLDYSQDRVLGNPNFKHPVCYAGRFFILIDVTGDVYRCPQMVDRADKINCIKMGVKAALDKVSVDTACKTCHIPCSTELNYYFGLKPSVLLNYVRTYQNASKINE